MCASALYASLPHPGATSRGAVAPSLAFGCFSPRLERPPPPKVKRAENYLSTCYILYLFYVKARAPATPRAVPAVPAPLCAAAVDARLTSEAVSAVNVVLRPLSALEESTFGHFRTTQRSDLASYGSK